MPNESSVKQRLLELAIETIDESGEPGIRVSELAEAVGVGLPTLYHHFGNREGLIEQAQAERFIRGLRENSEQLIALLENCTTKKELLAALSETFNWRRSAQRSDIRWQRLNALGATYARPALAERITQEHDAIITQVALALLPFQRKGVIRADVDLVALIAWYNGIVIGKNLLEIGNSSVNVAEWERIADEAILHALFGS
jgi:AcrR family transcriptional regulator